MKKIMSLILSVSLAAAVAGCSSSSSATTPSGQTAGEASKESITIAWLPNESGQDMGAARDEIGNLISKAIGKKVEHKTTTDYIIAIEAVANGNADVAFLGAQGYIEAHNKNKKVQPLVVPSGKSGTLDDAVYYSWLAVKKGNEAEYKQGDGFSIDKIAGKKFSFVSNSSTSGFKVPSTGIVGHFSKIDAYKSLTTEDLLEGGQDKFFSEVLFGGSHQGSAVNLLTGRADVAAFCDTCVNNYVELMDGTANRPGAVYQVKKDAAEPFNTLPGEQFSLISVTPVLNAPFVVNTEKVSAEDIKKMVDAFTTDEVANNQKIFVPKDSGFSGMFAKTGDERFVQVEDAWFDPIRELSK